MQTAIKIGPSKALQSTVLTGLGRINVFCGKNNSGKSTVLEAIASSKREDGIIFDEEYIHSIVAQLATTWANAHPNRYPLFQNLFQSAVAIHTDNAWFKSESNEFIQAIIGQINMGKDPRLAWDQGMTRHKYTELFSTPIKAAKIPENRRLELETHVVPQNVVSVEGAGLLNYLFYAKNQLSDNQPKRIYNRISEAFVSISEGFSFDVVMPHDPGPTTQSSIGLYFVRNRGDWMPARDCGFGLQELLLILYWAIEPYNNFICIEEPESHMHPDMQRRLAVFLREETNKQYFISTHSSVFLRPSVADKVYLVSLDDYINLNDATSKSVILTELGYDVVDNIVSDLVVLTEGPTDILVLEEFIGKYEVLNNYRIKCWPLGGDNMMNIDLAPIIERQKAIAIVDNDPGSEKARQHFVEECKRFGVECIRLKYRAIENYFTVDALRKVFGSQIPGDVTSINRDKPIKEQIGLSPKKKNWNVAREMSLDDIKGTDLELFFSKVVELCEEPLVRGSSPK